MSRPERLPRRVTWPHLRHEMHEPIKEHMKEALGIPAKLRHVPKRRY